MRIELNSNSYKPTVGIEPTTCALRKHCSTPELRWQIVTIDCTATGNDFQALGLTCQENDLPLGYKSNIAFRSLKDPTSPTQLGIEGMGDLFGMPMVMLFIIGIAAVFTGRSAQMGGIIIVALISVMIYLGYLPLMWESSTWVILIIIVILGIFIGKRWS